MRCTYIRTKIHIGINTYIRTNIKYINQRIIFVHAYFLKLYLLTFMNGANTSGGHCTSKYMDNFSPKPCILYSLTLPLHPSLHSFSHVLFYSNPKKLIQQLICQSQGLSSATHEQPTRVHPNLEQLPTRASQACRMLVQERSNLRGANLVVCQRGFVCWFSSSLQCFFIMCTQTWSLQMKTLIKRLMHKLHMKLYQKCHFSP